MEDVSEEGPHPRTLTVAQVEGLVEELATYHAHFAPFFQRSEQRAWAEVYLRGLLTADVPRKNVEAMALRLLGAGEGADRRVRALQQFVGEGGWDDDALLAVHRRLVDETLGEDDGVLLIDGSDIPKQGTHSVGVARQWCGATGKKDNCQAGVFLGYTSRLGYTLLDRRLYLPAVWFTPEYQERWEACAIPDGTVFQTKPELAAAMAEAVQGARDMRARWLACDEGYGKDPHFLDRVAATGLWYLAEAPCDTEVWPLVEPADGVTPRARPHAWVRPQVLSRKGPIPTRARPHPSSPPKLRLDALATQLPAGQWRRYRILEGSKGPLVADFVALRAVAVRSRTPGPEVWVLLRRTIPEPGEAPVLKYYLSQAPTDTPLATLVRVSGLRWPIESCFAEGKSEVGLDHYELRFWRGWRHHMTLVILAHHFLVRLQRRLDQRGGAPRASDQYHADLPAASDRARRVSGRRRSRDASPGAAPRPTARPDPAAGGHVAPGGPGPTDIRRRHRPGSPGLPAAPQPSRLLVPPQTYVAAPC